jgi:hypothetical protein
LWPICETALDREGTRLAIGDLIGLMRRKRALARHDRWTRIGLEGDQARKLAELRRFAYARSALAVSSRQRAL